MLDIVSAMSNGGLVIPDETSNKVINENKSGIKSKNP